MRIGVPSGSIAGVEAVMILWSLNGSLMKGYWFENLAPRRRGSTSPASLEPKESSILGTSHTTKASSKFDLSTPSSVEDSKPVILKAPSEGRLEISDHWDYAYILPLRRPFTTTKSSTRARIWLAHSKAFAHLLSRKFCWPDSSFKKELFKTCCRVVGFNPIIRVLWRGTRLA